MLTNVTFVGPNQHVRNQTRLKTNHTCKLKNAYNSINAHQRNEPVENWDRMKYFQINKLPKKGNIPKSY